MSSFTLAIHSLNGHHQHRTYRGIFPFRPDLFQPLLIHRRSLGHLLRILQLLLQPDQVASIPKILESLGRVFYR
jgi:hypothetical protein